MPKRKRITQIIFIVSLLLSLLQIWLCLLHITFLETIPNVVSANRLRRDWATTTTHRLLSPLAQQLYSHQHNCELPVAQFWFRNRFGLGSDLHVWSQAACNAMRLQVRVHTVGSWIWQSHSDCATTTTTTTTATYHDSTLACYFPTAEPFCPMTNQPTLNLTKARGVLVGNECREFREQHNLTVSAWRAVAMEYLFQTLSPQLQAEANRQLHLVFPNGMIPSSLITVHIRWGDKEDEMKLVPITKYILAVKQLANDSKHVHVYLSTTDPKAVFEFVSQSPKEWNIYVDAYFQEYYKHSAKEEYNVNPHMSLEHDGKPGFMALASLLVALEANAFVLTTASNWSRLMNELRQTIIDPECNHCTRMIDLRPGEW